MSELVEKLRAEAAAWECEPNGLETIRAPQYALREAAYELANLEEVCRRLESEARAAIRALEAEAASAYARGLEDAARVAESHGTRKDEQLDEIVKRATIDGQKNLDGAAVAAASMAISGSRIAATIRALKGESRE